MNTYRIKYRGIVKGSVTAFYSRTYTRVVKAENENKAALRAYDTHEHIPFGVEGVMCELIENYKLN